MQRSYLLLLVFLFLISGSRIASAATDPQDVSALKSLMNKWTDLPSSWRKSQDPCGKAAPWVGIGCTNSRITTLKLFSMGIGGTLGEDIGNLTQLQTLDLSSNPNLGGTLTPAIGKLTQLSTLKLLGCSFTGVIPDELGNLSQLTYLALNTNRFTGRIPPSLGKLSKLFWLDLADNQLSGPLPTSREYGHGLDQLLTAQHFHLNQNQLSGTIPENLFSDKMVLIHILLDRNRLNGSIPASIGGIGTLEVLRLNNNNLGSTVPSNINNLTNLQVLDLAHNNLVGQLPNLTGMSRLQNVDLSNNSFDPSEVPSWLSDLPSIMALLIESGGLHGQLPQKLFSFPHLQQVILSNNHLNGTIDYGGNVSDRLDVVNLENNNITGVTLSANYSETLMLAGNPVCSNPILAYTLCKGRQENTDGIPDNLHCSNPFVESMIFRAPSFGEYVRYVSQLKENFTASLKCNANVSVQNAYFDSYGYLWVKFKLCPVNKKYFSREEVLNCFDMSRENYEPPEIFGPYYVMGSLYPFEHGAAKGILIGVAVGSVLLVIGLVLVGMYALRQKKRAQRAISLSNPFASWGSTGEDSGDAPKLSGAKCFSYEELKWSTNDFKEINVIGSGGYGKVYRGKLPDGQIVAIKRSKEGSMQGGLEFKTEIELLSRVHHKNLVGLVGFCFEKGERMLVYEFISSGSLSEGLYGMKDANLDWNRRLRIALDSARGLAYLHDHANPPIIHRDVKSSNILLDDKLTAKVADFGLSLLVSDSEEGHITEHVKGTLGYLDPEYYMTQQLTAKSDVYSFGVVMLELIVARPPIHQKKYIVREVKTAFDTQDSMYCGLRDVIDPVLQRQGVLIGFRGFLELALQCVEDSAADRPTMNEVVKAVEAILQKDGLTANLTSSSSSFSSDSRSVKGALRYPHHADLQSSNAVNMNSSAFDYSGGFPSHISLKTRST